MRLYIKYMVSLRCKLFVKQILENLGLHYVIVDLGMVEILEDISPAQHNELQAQLALTGLELLDDKKNILIERIKVIIIEMVHYSEDVLHHNASYHLSQKLGCDYAYLSKIFSEVKGITIQQFIINHKIERIKELLLYDELSLTEIAFRMHYSSVAHLSNQFKKLTGLTPKFFKKLKFKREQNLEDL